MDFVGSVTQRQNQIRNKKKLYAFVVIKPNIQEGRSLIHYSRTSVKAKNVAAKTKHL